MSTTRRTTIRSNVHRIICEVTFNSRLKGKIHDSQTLEELGVGSLEAVEVILHLEKDFDFEIPDTAKDAEIETVGELIDLIDRYLPAGHEIGQATG